ncbi:MAG: hypothetical protein KGQ41_05530, partial [Alphaproteobacteria bacterium]|nr:hypothetical protein [Alphaproteobacteria bacterium]
MDIKNPLHFADILDLVTYTPQASDFWAQSSRLANQPADSSSPHLADALIKGAIGSEMVCFAEAIQRNPSPRISSYEVSVSFNKCSLIESAYDYAVAFVDGSDAHATREGLCRALIAAVRETSISGIIAETDIKGEDGKTKTIPDPRHRTCLTSVDALEKLATQFGPDSKVGEEAICAIMAI